MTDQKDKPAYTPLPLSEEATGRAPGHDRLRGKRILIVGGGQRTVDADTDPVGNGRAMSLLFAREGAQVAVADIDSASAKATVDQVTAEGGTAHAITADISEPDQVQSMVRQGKDALSGLDGIVLNVGIGAGMRLEGSTPNVWDQVMAVNLRGPMLACRAALPEMEEGGSILFISSVASMKPGSHMPSYDASKAALAGLMRHVALEAERKAIRANIIAPGLIDTPLGRLSTQGRPSRAKTNIPGGRQGTGWEVAYAALFLMSGEASYINGQILAVDAGLTAIR